MVDKDGNCNHAAHIAYGYSVCPDCQETLRLAAEALKRKPLTREQAVAAGVDFILNCPLGEYSQSDAAGES